MLPAQLSMSVKAVWSMAAVVSMSSVSPVASSLISSLFWSDFWTELQKVSRIFSLQWKTISSYVWPNVAHLHRASNMKTLTGTHRPSTVMERVHRNCCLSECYQLKSWRRRSSKGTCRPETNNKSINRTWRTVQCSPQKCFSVLPHIWTFWRFHPFLSARHSKIRTFRVYLEKPWFYLGWISALCCRTHHLRLFHDAVHQGIVY